MARFQPRTFSTILERMAARVVARTELTDLEEGGVLHTILAAVARELDDINYQMVNLQRVWDIDTASNEDLDDRAQDLNPDKLSRLGATKATGTVVFSRTGTTGTVTIPVGSVVRVPGGGPAFETTAAGTINNGDTDSGAVPIIAQEAGADGSVDAAAISQMDAVTGVETVTNAANTTGGQDEETDVQFRERIKSYLRSLPRGTPDALKYAALSTSLDAYGKIVTAEVVERSGSELGIVDLYVDDGAGTIVFTDNNVGTPETVVAVAIGGEVRLFLDNKPLVQGFPVAVELNAVPLVEGTDFTVNHATGQITLDPVLYPSGLAPGDAVTAEYYWYEGLIAECQKIIDGDPTDRDNYPGYRAAGVQVLVVPPTIYSQVIEAQVVVADGFDGTDVRTKVASAILRYVNGLGLNGDVILSELIYQAQSVPGVVDVTFTTPTANVVIGEGELARVDITNIDLT